MQSFGARKQEAFIAKFSSSGNLIYAARRGGYAHTLTVDQQYRVSFGGMEFVIQDADRLLSANLNTDSQTVLSCFTEIDQREVVIDLTENRNLPINATSNFQAAMVVLPNITIDLSNEFTSTLITEQFTPQARRYPLLNIAPLHQVVKFKEPLSINLLYSHAVLDAEKGIDFSRLPGWLRFSFSDGRLTGAPTGSVRGEYFIDLVVNDVLGKQ